MKLSNGRSLYRYEIAEFLNMNVKELYRFLKRKDVKISSGIVLPCDLDRIEAVYFGENNAQERSNEDIKEGNIPQRG
jgi:hypothetical protein